MKKLSTLFFALCLLCVTHVGNAQAIKKADLVNAWSKMTNMFLTTTRDMPAEHFSFQPTKDIAPFGDLVGHTIGANYLFGPTVNGPKVERPEFDAANKKEVVENMEKSFKYIADAIDQLSDDNLNDEIEWFGSKMTRLKAILSMTDHVEREYGKVITYARLKGVKPAGGRGW
ncbi:DinB family protein [Roseivirga sp.]|uniref:DinB family protein n=1 Tax=Roseivirga sp. TaxID=1964215 RepID=UPI003B51C012